MAAQSIFVIMMLPFLKIKYLVWFCRDGLAYFFKPPKRAVKKRCGRSCAVTPAVATIAAYPTAFDQPELKIKAIERRRAVSPSYQRWRGERSTKTCATIAAPARARSSLFQSNVALVPRLLFARDKVIVPRVLEIMMNVNHIGPP
jgi:hypothetical protein